MNNIPSVQNQQIQLERLSAQRELYSSAKKLYSIQIFGNVPIPIAISFLALFFTKLAPYGAAYSICFLIVDIIFITPAIPLLKRKAAKIQELFDCDVLNIVKSSLKTATDISVEEVLSNYNAHSKIKSNVEKVKDWYPKEVGLVNIAIARLICQRTNCWWDSKLRGKYCNYLKGSTIILPIILIITGIVKGLSFETIMLVSSTLIPFFQFCAKEYNDNKDAIDRLDSVRIYIQNLWDQILIKSIDYSSLDRTSRAIQDEIFEHRTKSPLILNYIYNLLRDKDELLMAKTAEILVNEIISANADFD